MAHTWTTVGYRGYDLDIVVEGDQCIYEGIYDNIRLRKKSGEAMSERLEKALFKKYGEDSFAENLYEIGEGGDY